MATDQDLKINTLEVMMEQNACEHKEIKGALTKLDNKFDEVLRKFDEALEKKANKWVETAMRWAFMSAGVVFIGLIVRWIVLLELK